MPGCTFAADLIADDAQRAAACPAPSSEPHRHITNKPAVVIIANACHATRLCRETGQGDGARGVVGLDAPHRRPAQGSVGKIVFWPPACRPPSGLLREASSSPFDRQAPCRRTWRRFADQEKRVASRRRWVWIDSRPWFCANLRLPRVLSWDGPTKYDAEHMSSTYGLKIAPVIAESLRAAGVLP